MDEYRNKLVELGKQAGIYKSKYGLLSIRFAKKIEEIDAVVAEWKAAQPDKFWSDDDPEYKIKSNRWRDRRLRTSVPLSEIRTGEL